MFNRLLYIVTVLFLLSASLTALDLSQPSDPIYQDLEYWQERGYIDHLPPLRPYPSQFVKEKLQEVMEKGSPRDQKQAETYLKRIGGDIVWNLQLRGDGKISNKGLNQSWGGARFAANGYFSPNLSYWGELGGNGVLRYEEGSYYTYLKTSPYGDRPWFDMVDDAGTIAGISLMGSFHGMLSFGRDDLYLSSGIYPASFGPFWEDSIVISSKAFQQGHLDLVWIQDKFSYTMSFLELVGTDNTGDGLFAEKYMALHSYNWTPSNNLEFSFFESVIFGNRLEPLYLMPFSYLFYSQGFIGFADNSLMGLSARVQLPADLEYNGILYVDDVGFNELIKFQFDTKLKIAVDTGITWSPGFKWMRRLHSSYTAVMPYMYTHADWHESKKTATDINGSDSFNVDNYTHFGQNLGVTLSPNSDRVNLELEMAPGPDTQLRLFGNYIRHGNHSIKGDTNVVPTDGTVPNDGTIFDAGIDEDGELYFQRENRFMEQDVLEKVIQLGFTLDTEIPMPAMDDQEYYRMRFILGYTHEWIFNSGRESDYGYEPQEGNDEQNYYLSLGISFIF